MLDSVTNQPSSIFIGGRQFNNLRFADDSYPIAGSESELQTITDVLEKSSAYGMEINHDKCKIIVNGEGPSPMIYMYDKNIENVEHFKYLGAILTNSGNSKNEIRIRLATAVSALVKLEKIWRSGEIELKLKFRLYNSRLMIINDILCCYYAAINL